MKRFGFFTVTMGAVVLAGVLLVGCSDNENTTGNQTGNRPHDLPVWKHAGA